MTTGTTTTTTTDNNIDRMQEFYKVLDLAKDGLSWDEVESKLSSFYDDNCVYEIGGGQPNIGKKEILEMSKQTFGSKASFQVDKIEERTGGQGIYASGWMRIPGMDDNGMYVQSISKFNKDGKFIHIQNIDTTSSYNVQAVRENLAAAATEEEGR